MLKRKIKCENFDGEETEEEFYFNLSKAELIEMEVEYKEGMTEFLKRIIKTNDRKELVKTFKELVLKAYGEKSEDGKRFVKNDDLRESFSQTAAYQELFMELATDNTKAAEFMTGIMPKDFAEAMAKDELQKKTAEALTAVPDPPSA